jgi:hypothetical protein
MTALPLVGTGVRILVSDPWEFGTECGVGPFAAMILDAHTDALLLKLRVPIEYRGARLQTVVARARHAPGTIEPLTSEGHLAANFAFLRSLVTTLSQVTDDAKAGMVPAIGSIESTDG